MKRGTAPSLPSLPLVQTLMPPPPMRPPRVPPGVRVRQRTAPELGIEAVHHTPQFDAGARGKPMQNRLQRVPGDRDIVRDFTAGAAALRRNEHEIAAGTPQKHPAGAQRCLRDAGPQIVMLTLRPPELCTRPLRQPVDPAVTRVEKGWSRCCGAHGAGPVTRHRPFGMRACPASCHAAVRAAALFLRSPLPAAIPAAIPPFSSATALSTPGSYAPHPPAAAASCPPAH